MKVDSRHATSKQSSRTLDDIVDVELGGVSSKEIVGNALLGEAVSVPTDSDLVTQLRFGIVDIELSPTKSVAGETVDFESSPSSAQLFVGTSYEYIQCSLDGFLYNSLEIYGLKTPSRGRSTIPLESSGGNNLEANSTESGQVNTEDECVVCLNDKKSVALLPCR